MSLRSAARRAASPIERAHRDLVADFDRVIAVGLMVVGIGFIGVFTATITSFFFDQERSTAVEILEFP